jgi:hypothetical protein
MKIMGIDPGKTGSISLLEYNRDSLVSSNTFTIPEDINDCYSLLKELNPECILLEEVHSYPGQSSVATFTFGESYGVIKTLIAISGIRYKKVSPQAWQKLIGFKNPKGTEYAERKKNLYSFAKQLFPGSEFNKSQCDSILIALACRTYIKTGLF